MPVARMGKAATCLGRCGLLIRRPQVWRRPQVRPDHQTPRHEGRIWHCANINGTVGSHAIVIVRVGAMPFQNHYVITENIERFEGLLREGELDSLETRTVEFLLAQARAELAECDAPCVRFAVAGHAAALVAAMAGLATTLT